MAPLLPKLRGHFAEFLNNASPVGLGLLDLSTCVGFQYGCLHSYSGFSRQIFTLLPYSFSVRVTRLLSAGGFSSLPGSVLAPCFPFRAKVLYPLPHSSVCSQHRILHLLSIAYASPPRLRSRLTQGRSALPWNPWTSGLDDSHIHLATHSGILSSMISTAPSGTASSFIQCSPTTPCSCMASMASAACFSPVYFRRGDSRLVSYYALFECVAASEPTS